MNNGVNAQRCRVLVVGRDQDIADLFKLMMFRQPYEVHYVATSADALASAERDLPGLIISALTLGDGVDCEEFCARVKAHAVLHTIPVLLYGGRSVCHVYPLAHRAGAAGYLNLPLHPKQFLAVCAAVIGGGTYFPFESGAGATGGTGEPDLPLKETS